MIVDIDIDYVPENLFTNEKILNGFLECVPRTFGEVAYLGMVPGTDRRQIVLEKPAGYENLNYAEGQYSLEVKLQDMAEAGVDVGILRLPVWHEWLPTEMCRIVNDGLADMVKRSNGKLLANAILPPWATKECVYELERCVKELGMVGVQLTCHYGKLYLDHEIFKPYFKILNALNLPVIVHHTPVPVEYESIKDYTNQRRFYGRCIDQGIAVGRELFSDMFEQFPNLKLIHTMLGGAFYAFQNILLPNVSKTGEAMERFKTDSDRHRGYLKNNLYFDMSHALPWGKEQLECAIKVCGADHVLFASSYPVRREWLLKGVDFVKSLNISEEEKSLVLGGNAQKLFNIKKIAI
ncbi:MAG: amidohydrolase 2 [Firmicutes bacterium]|nr:amidohydrolase 2 [Bacillota bacterium]